MEDALEATAKATEEPKATKDNVNLVLEEFKSECKRIVVSVKKLKDEIEGHDDEQMAVNVAVNYEKTL